MVTVGTVGTVKAGDASNAEPGTIGKAPGKMGSALVVLTSALAPLDRKVVNILSAV